MSKGKKDANKIPVSTRLSSAKRSDQIMNDCHSPVTAISISDVYKLITDIKVEFKNDLSNLTTRIADSELKRENENKVLREELAVCSRQNDRLLLSLKDRERTIVNLETDFEELISKNKELSDEIQSLKDNPIHEPSGSETKKSRTILKNTGDVVVNELLCYLSHKIQVMDKKRLVEICAEFYDAASISNAKTLLNVHGFFDGGLPGRYNTRNKEKSSSDLEDIVDAFYDADQTGKAFPTFCAIDLNMFPRPKHVVLFEELYYVKRDVSELMGLINVVHDLKDFISHRFDGFVPYTDMSAVVSSNKSLASSHPVRPKELSYSSVLKSNVQPKRGVAISSGPVAATAVSATGSDTVTTGLEADVDDGFKLVRNQRRRKPKEMKTGTLDTPSLRGVGRKKDMYIGRLDIDATVEDVTAHMKSDYLNINPLEITRLDNGKGDFSSFHVRIFDCDVKTFLEADKWPLHVIVRYFRNFKKWRENHPV